MSSRREIIEEANPTAHNTYRGNFLERFMLRRINAKSLLLPADFDEISLGGLVVVAGQRSDTRTKLGVDQTFPAEANKPDQVTRIDILREEDQSLADLQASRQILDGNDTLKYQRFILGAENNELPLLDVMRTVSLGVNVVQAAETARFYAEHPEAAIINIQ